MDSKNKENENLKVSRRKYDVKKRHVDKLEQIKLKNLIKEKTKGKRWDEQESIQYYYF